MGRNIQDSLNEIIDEVTEDAIHRESNSYNMYEEYRRDSDNNRQHTESFRDILGELGDNLRDPQRMQRNRQRSEGGPAPGGPRDPRNLHGRAGMDPRSSMQNNVPPGRDPRGMRGPNGMQQAQEKPPATLVKIDNKFQRILVIGVCTVFLFAGIAISRQIVIRDILNQDKPMGFMKTGDVLRGKEIAEENKSDVDKYTDQFLNNLDDAMEESTIEGILNSLSKDMDSKDELPTEAELAYWDLDYRSDLSNFDEISETIEYYRGVDYELIHGYNEICSYKHLGKGILKIQMPNGQEIYYMVTEVPDVEIAKTGNVIMQTYTPSGLQDAVFVKFVRFN